MIKAESYRISQIAEILNSQYFIGAPEVSIKKIAIDSRTLGDAANSLFFAIKAQRDGHSFIDDVYRLGVRSFVVANEGLEAKYPNANWLVVKDTLSALQLLAAYHRGQKLIKTIAITGSNGKTVVKEWLYQLLSADFNIIRSPKSYNSQIGVPLSVWQISDDHDLSIFEAGISTIDEMETLESIILPNIGILTNIKAAHDKGFANNKQKLKEKLKLFKHVDLLVFSPDYVPTSVDINVKRKFTWSFTQFADLQVLRIDRHQSSAVIIVKYQHAEFRCTVPFTDAASLENVVICLATLLAMGKPMDDILSKVGRLTSVDMRLQLLTGINDCSLIDDSYSADLSSLAIALDFLNQQNQYTKRTLILSDLQETGKANVNLYGEIANLIAQKKISRIIGIGPNFIRFACLFKIEKVFFEDTEMFLAQFNNLHFNRESILVKGARKFGFEAIVKRLTQKIHDTVLEINLNSLLANLQFYKAKLAPQVKVMAMVKAFSYGSGSFEIANLLQHHKVDYLAVAYVDEGIALRKSGITLPIMVVSPEPSAFYALVKYKLEPEIYSLTLLVDFINFLPTEITDYPIHLKLDTGMHRLGFEQYSIGELTAILKQSKRLKVRSVFTHLVASANAEHDAFTRHQVTLYQQMYNEIAQCLPQPPLKHVLNTSGVTRWPTFYFDMVRIGIGMYGFDSALSTDGQLLPVASLKTTISQIKNIAANQSVGYDRKGVLSKGGKIATVKIGYADGYCRAFGQGVGKMQVHGKLAPTIGAICMDMCMLDITGIDACEGDEVVVFNDKYTIMQLAEAIQTIPYEILTNISQRVKRVYHFE